MSSAIIYHKMALRLPASQYGFDQDRFLLIQQSGSSNCYECSSGRRARSWVVLHFGTVQQIIEREIVYAGDCAGAAVKNRVMTQSFTPEQYITAARGYLRRARDHELGASFPFKDGYIRCFTKSGSGAERPSDLLDELRQLAQEDHSIAVTKLGISGPPCR